MALEGSPFLYYQQGVDWGVKMKGSDWLLLKVRAGGKRWGMDVWYAARYQIN